MRDDYIKSIQDHMNGVFEYHNGTQDDLMARAFIEHLYRRVIECDHDHKHLYRWELGKEIIKILGSNIVKPDNITPATLFDIPIQINNHAPCVIRLWRLMNYE